MLLGYQFVWRFQQYEVKRRAWVRMWGRPIDSPFWFRPPHLIANLAACSWPWRIVHCMPTYTCMACWDPSNSTNHMHGKSGISSQRFKRWEKGVWACAPLVWEWLGRHYRSLHVVGNVHAAYQPVSGQASCCNACPRAWWCVWTYMHSLLRNLGAGFAPNTYQTARTM